MTNPVANTPLMKQYEGVKARYPGHLVLFRVGDFFETFGDDAKLLSKELEVVLTARAPEKDGARTPMAGVPFHAVDAYLGRLVQKGYKVALCDQVEDARFAKGLVRREVTRVVTPGTVVEERILPGPDHNFLASVLLDEGPARFAIVDVTTGEWYRGEARTDGVEGAVAALAPFAPREVLARARGPDGQVALRAALRRELPNARIEDSPEPLAPSDAPAGLEITADPSEFEADLRLAGYIRSAQPRLLPYVAVSEELPGTRHLVLDAKTLRHLEISRPMNPDDPGGSTLLTTWDETRTAAGRRTLAFWLKHPLADLPRILARQEAVAWFVDRGAELLAWRLDLGGISDVARIGARIAGRRIRPTELATLAESLRAIGRLADRLRGAFGATPAIQGLTERLDPLPDLLARLEAAIPKELLGAPEESTRFRPGFAPELDAPIATAAQGVADLEALEHKEQAASGIRTLKIGFNQVFGYYFEVSKPNLPRVPSHFRRKQTISGAERFTSEELEGIEARILEARDRAREAENELWERFLVEIESHLPRLYRVSRALGELDALAAFATVAQERGHVRPVVDDSTELQIRDGRHPILDRSLGGRFVPNDAELDARGARLLVLTGPNMSGKSTYMRQIGLLVVLAQAGAFVPARYARIGLVTSLYTRMGFTDEIGRGKSSFMVEMTEVAEILEGADDRSLVLLDEVGRGTSTFDGLALAWATLRHLHETVRCRTVLATHYHQLTELIERLPGARNAHLAVRDDAGSVVFLHRVVPGSTDKSYGIHVARLAGLPGSLLEEADRLLRHLEREGVAVGGSREGRSGGPRYTQAILLPAHEPPRPSPLEAELAAIDPDTLTPLEALQWIAKARRRARPPDAEKPS